MKCFVFGAVLGVCRFALGDDLMDSDFGKSIVLGQRLAFHTELSSAVYVCITRSTYFLQRFRRGGNLWGFLIQDFCNGFFDCRVLAHAMCECVAFCNVEMFLPDLEPELQG